MATANSIEDLQLWQAARALAKLAYELTYEIIEKKDYSLVDQIRRSAISVPSNIAEGFGRGSQKDFLRFLYIAQGSLEELKTQLIIANDLGYLTSDSLSRGLSQAKAVGRPLKGLMNYLDRYIRNPNEVQEEQSAYGGDQAGINDEGFLQALPLEHSWNLQPGTWNTK